MTHAEMVYAAIPVADIESAMGWYEKLLGRPCDERPMKEAAEWKLTSGGGIQLVLDAGRAGRSMATIGVTDVAVFAADAGARGIHAEVSAPGEGLFRLAQVKDPDGNQLTFAEDRRKNVAHVSFPGESAAYRTARNALLADERELRRLLERVASGRRALPPGGLVPTDYRFVSETGPVKMSELFGDKPTLVVYSFMFGPERKTPCPDCTHFLDGIAGQGVHIDQRTAFHVVAKSPIERILGFAKERGWKGLHFLSTDGNDYDRDYFGDSQGLTPAMREQQAFEEDGKVWDMPMLNVFRKDGDGIRHFWGSELLYAPTEPGQQYRHNDLLDPLWNLLDVTPEGRGDFNPKLAY